MNNWSYRVIEFAANQGKTPRRELREVSYDELGQPLAYGAVAHVAWDVDEDPSVPYAILERMRSALDQPVLHASDFNPGSEQRNNKVALSYTVVLEKDPDSDGLFLPLPKNLLDEEDWRTGDRINIEVISEGHAVLTNLSKAEREA